MSDQPFIARVVAWFTCWWRGHDFIEREGYGGYLLSPCRRCCRLRGFL